ncbi:MAG: hypothetical protein JXA90_14200 [Planctomycetes bacterium]|nr:hypothetical protein [Planctomycetota bacterium]
MHHWAFIYQYAIGGALFGICTLLLIRSRAIDLRARSGRRGLTILLGGLLLYAAFHAVSIFVLPKS